MKKALILILCALILVGISVGATLAITADNRADTIMAAESAGQPEAESSGADSDATGPESSPDDDIIILFTNDVHCNLDGNIGYAGLAAYKSYIETKSRYVTLVDAGDAVQGSYLGAVSQGELPIQIMNRVGYDLAAFGNHEFDYGMDRLTELIGIADYEYLCCNISYTGSGESALAGIEPYRLVEYGGITVAFIGVDTPLCRETSTPAHFKENGEYAYDVCADGTGEALAKVVQANVDECRAKGADYVILIAHLGDTEESMPYTSSGLIEATNGIDALIDGHSHDYVSCRIVKNKDGEEVLTAQTGTGLSAIGQLTITRGGTLIMGCVSDFTEKDDTITQYIAELSAEYEESLGHVIGHTDQDLSITDANGVRLVRNRETGIGNLCADAYRAVSEADIAYVNGGGVRSTIPAGDITYKDIINVHPFGNMLCTMKVTGQEILDILEYASSLVMSEYQKDGTAIGECGSFANVSGLKYTINTAIPSPVVVDSNDMLVSIEGERRVSDVSVLKDGEYVPIDPEATYTLASHDYMLKNGGCGMELYLAGHQVELDSIMPDYMVLMTYLQTNPDMSRYYQPEGRVTVK